MTTADHSDTYPTMPKATCGDVEGLSMHEAADLGLAASRQFWIPHSLTAAGAATPLD